MAIGTQNDRYTEGDDARCAEDDHPEPNPHGLPAFFRRALPEVHLWKAYRAWEASSRPLFRPSAGVAAHELRGATTGRPSGSLALRNTLRLRAAQT